MTKKTNVPEKYQAWIDARKRYHLSDTQVQMARELGLNPRKFGKISNEDQESWKASLPQFIEGLYFKRFGREQPELVRSIEQMLHDQREKKAKRKNERANPAGEQPSDELDTEME
jgi:hypothetical protein